jgi:hypothetical protein
MFVVNAIGDFRINEPTDSSSRIVFTQGGLLSAFFDCILQWRTMASNYGFVC